MKKLVTSVLLSLGVILLLPAGAFAAKSVTEISGTVTYQGSPVSGASVTVSCGTKSKSTTTAPDGTYLVQFNAKNCPSGADATVSASATLGSGKNKKTDHGSSSGSVSGAGTDRINVAIINVALPEFGGLTAIGAAVLGAGSFLVVRRRQSRATER